MSQNTKEIYGVWNIHDLEKQIKRFKKNERENLGVKRLSRNANVVIDFTSVEDSSGDSQLSIKEMY